MDNNTVELIFEEDAADRVIEWPFTMAVPMKGGTVQLQTGTARFRLLADTENKTNGEQAAASFLSALRSERSNEDIVRDAVVGFVGLKDKNGNAVDDDKAKALFLKLPYACIGLARGYFEMAQGRLPKNS